MNELSHPTIIALVTGIVSIISSNGFWSMRMKRLELEYKEQSEKDETAQKLDEVIEVVKGLQSSIDHLTKEQASSDELLIAVARDRIYHICKTFTKNRDTDPDNMRDIKALLEPYKAKGGDGLADEYFDRYRNMYVNNGGGD